MNALRFLYSPMVMMSLLLHGLFLIMPLPSQPEVKPETPEPKEEEVKLSSISSLKIAPQPSPIAPSPRPQAKPLIRPASAARPQPPRPPVLAPSPVPPSPIPTPSPVAAAPSPVSTPSPSPLPSPSAPLSQGQLQSSAVAGVGQASAAQFYSFFPDPAAFFTAESLQAADSNLTDPVPVEGVTNMTRLERVDLAQTRDTYLPEMYPGATITQIGTYGGGDLYEVRQGSTVGYVVLLKEKSLGLASYVIEWNRDPTQPQTAAGLSTP